MDFNLRTQSLKLGAMGLLISDAASIGRRDICLFSDPPSTEIYEGNSTIQMFNILNRMYVRSLREFGGKVREIFDVSD